MEKYKEEYKEEYNYWLKRYYNGIKFLNENPESYEKYIENLLKIREELDKIISENNMTSDEILNGF